MRILLVILLFAAFGFSCESEVINNEEESTVAMIQAEEISNFTCINSQADEAIPLEDATSKIVGEWQLKAILTMIQSNEVPNIVLKIDNNLEVSVLEAGKKVHDDKLKITVESGENYSILKLESSRGEFSNGNYNFLYGNLRVCDNELFIDNGIAFDAPGYYFRKR